MRKVTFFYIEREQKNKEKKTTERKSIENKSFLDLTRNIYDGYNFVELIVSFE